MWLVCAPQIGLVEDIKKQFWEDLNMVIQDISQSKKHFIREDFNGNIGVKADVYDTPHRGFGFGRETMKEFLS